MASPVKVLIVDDSVFILRTLQKMLESCPDIEIVGTALNGREAVEKTFLLKPDIITMDIEMPVMNGIEATRIIMEVHPVPILVISTHTTEGSQVTMDALTSGAVDFIVKNSSYNSSVLSTLREEIISKILEIARSTQFRNVLTRQKLLRNNGIHPDPNIDISHSSTSSSHKSNVSIRVESTTTATESQNKSSQSLVRDNSLIRNRSSKSSYNIAIIGVSTGGPLSLQKVIPELPANFPIPIVVVQHMPSKFTASLAERLDSIARLRVKEAEDGEQLCAGTVYIAPGGMVMTIASQGIVKITSDVMNLLYKPSVDMLAESVLDTFGGNVLAVMMTGMGRDGAESYKKLANAGAHVIAQNAETCVVYGMPKAVIEAGSAKQVLPLEEIAPAMMQCVLSGNTTTTPHSLTTSSAVSTH